MAEDRLDSFRIYKLACQLFDDFWNDSEIVGKDYRGKELVKQQIYRWLDNDHQHNRKQTDKMIETSLATTHPSP